MQPLIAVQYQPAWLTWLAATSTCLPALDVTHDLTDLAGYSAYAWGLWGYQMWASALKAGRIHPLGNAYNAHCWHEARHHAAKFLTRIAQRTPAVAEPLSRAGEHLAAVAAELKAVAALFPFPPPEEPSTVESRLAAAEHLMAAKAHEERAIVNLHETCDTNWPIDT